MNAVQALKRGAGPSHTYARVGMAVRIRMNAVQALKRVVTFNLRNSSYLLVRIRMNAVQALKLRRRSCMCRICCQDQLESA